MAEKSKTGIYARNLIADWIGYGANILVMLFLSPFVIGHLGAEIYGLWSLMVSLTGYLGLADLGVRVSTGRHLNYYLGKGQLHRARSVINTSLVTYGLLGAVIVGLAVLGGRLVPILFPRVAADAAHMTMIVLPLLGVNLWMGFFTATLSQLLYAQDRFDLVNLCNVLVLLARAGATVWVLLAGGSLPALALVQIASAILACILLYGLAANFGPSMRYSRVYVRLRTARELLSFGGWAFAHNVAVRIIAYTDIAVIAALLGAKSVAIYSVALMLIEYARIVLSRITTVFHPDLHKFAGAGNHSAVRFIMVRSTRLTGLLATGLLGIAFILAPGFIRLWLNENFLRAASVIRILAIAVLFEVLALTAVTTLQGLGKVRQLAGLAGVEAATNLLLSVVLVTALHLELQAVAYGTLIPMAIMSLAKTATACRAVNLRFDEFSRGVYFRVFSAGLILIACGLIVLSLVPMRTWGSLIGCAAVLSAIYFPLGWFVILDESDRRSLSDFSAGLLVRLGLPRQML